ncbi:MAG: hypothetical protein K5872_05875 [Rhizobiaceae bacterium]|nr:hypothetical protein [Rhizobiaceae bacterium]MCV0405740.1 hypothetical protein [Rhizobiaceae bacterium]
MTDLLRILVSPVAWLAAFSAVYGLHGVLCSMMLDATVFGMSRSRLVLALAFVVAVLLQAGLLAMLYSTRYGAAPGFARVVSRASGWTGLVATIWTLFPTLAVSTCP